MLMIAAMLWPCRPRKSSFPRRRRNSCSRDPFFQKRSEKNLKKLLLSRRRKRMCVLNFKILYFENHFNLNLFFQRNALLAELSSVQMPANAIFSSVVHYKKEAPLKKPKSVRGDLFYALVGAYSINYFCFLRTR
jgi:hypothetical protein